MVNRSALFFLMPLMLALNLSGCASGGKGFDPLQASQVQVLETLPTPDVRQVETGSGISVIGPNDKLRVEVFNVPELQLTVRTDAQGAFAFPLVGRIEAIGKTPYEVASYVADNLRGRYVLDPQVTVNVEEVVSRSVTVDGQVTKPGLFPVVGRISLARAVAMAGGTSEFARLKDVVVFRKVDNKDYAGIYNLEAIRRGQYSDPEIYPNDVIYVGDSPARRRFKDIIQAAPLLTTPLLILFR